MEQPNKHLEPAPNPKQNLIRRGRVAQVDQLVCSTLPGAPDVYLVPGTWAAGVFRTVFTRGLPPPPDWTKQDSEFVKCAQKNLPGSGIFRLIWGGRNRASDRTNGADVLREAIGQDREKAKIIVCHSHGGSVALDSLSKGGAMSVQGVVCLNTPFFAYLRRNTQDAFVSTFFLWVLSGLSWLLVLKEESLLLLAGMWLVVLVLSVMKGPGWIQAKEEKYDVDLSTPNIDNVRFLCLTTWEDEAFGVLNLVDSVGNLPFLFIGKWSPWIFAVGAIVLTTIGWLPLLEFWKDPGLSPPLSRFVWTGLGVLVVLVLAGLAVRVRKFSPDKWSPWTFVVLAIVLTSPWWLPLLGRPWHLSLSYLWSGFAWAGLAHLFFLVLTFPAVVVSRFFAQGIWDPVAPYFVRTLVTITPITARRVKFAELKPSRPKDMNHAMLHDDAVRTWEEIKKWKDEEFGS